MSMKSRGRNDCRDQTLRPARSLLVPSSSDRTPTFSTALRETPGLVAYTRALLLRKQRKHCGPPSCPEHVTSSQLWRRRPATAVANVFLSAAVRTPRALRLQHTHFGQSGSNRHSHNSPKGAAAARTGAYMMSVHSDADDRRRARRTGDASCGCALMQDGARVFPELRAAEGDAGIRVRVYNGGSDSTFLVHILETSGCTHRWVLKTLRGALNRAC